MKIYLLGKGKVGTALSRHFNTDRIPFIQCRNHLFSKKSGVIFVAVTDDITYEIISEIRSRNPGLYIIHFSAATHFKDTGTFLFHPYLSVSKNTNLSEVLFTLWGCKNKDIENMLEKIGFHFIYAGLDPSPLYHISAVISGNFTQYFFLTAVEILQKEGFSLPESIKLVKQLIDSSILNIVASGIEGITGPAARGDENTIRKETAELFSTNDDLSKTFSNINMLILKAVKNGSFLK